MDKKGNGVLRMVTLILVFCSFIIAIGMIGYSKWNRLNQDLKFNYENRIVQINQLASLKLIFLEDIVLTSQLYSKQEISYSFYLALLNILWSEV